jgi:hypothetical protein
MWAKPQALMWERHGQQVEVALYVRNLTLVEAPGSPVNAGTLLRQQSDSLGLTTPGLRFNRWKIMRDEVSAVPSGQPAVPQSSSRGRLKVVRSAGAA